MSFIRTGLREIGLKIRRQRTRMVLRHEKRLLQKSEIILGREGTSQAANFPELRNEIVALKKLEQEQKEVALRIAQIEEGIKKVEAQRQANAREQSEAMAKLEAEKRPTSSCSENCPSFRRSRHRRRIWKPKLPPSAHAVYVYRKNGPSLFAPGLAVATLHGLPRRNSSPPKKNFRLLKKISRKFALNMKCAIAVSGTTFARSRTPFATPNNIIRWWRSEKIRLISTSAAILRLKGLHRRMRRICSAACANVASRWIGISNTTTSSRYSPGASTNRSCASFISVLSRQSRYWRLFYH